MRSSQRSIIDPFIVMDIMERAQAVEQKGQSVVHMEVGQPGTSAPKAAKEFLKSSMEDNPIGYTVALGLPDLRKKIADDKSIPPYVIFQDPSLNEMTFRYPISTDELSSIFGVGEGKAKKYGKDFIELIAKHVEENNIDRPDDMVVKSAGKNSSLKLFIIQGVDRKLSIEDIAQSKSMQFEELISEMETIVYSGTKLDLSYCIEEYLDEDQQDELFDYFIESESDDIWAAAGVG